MIKDVSLSQSGEKVVNRYFVSTSEFNALDTTTLQEDDVAFVKSIDIVSGGEVTNIKNWTGTEWVDGGVYTVPIKQGPQGKQGPKGDTGSKGDPGKDFDVSTLSNEDAVTLKTKLGIATDIDNAKTEVTNSFDAAFTNKLTTVGDIVAGTETNPITNEQIGAVTVTPKILHDAIIQLIQANQSASS